MQGSCPDIKNSLAIDYRNGHIQIGSCCASGRIKVDESPINTYLSNRKLIEIKQDNENNILRDDYCKWCVDPEYNGQPSRRQDVIQAVKSKFFKEGESLTRLDVSLNNLCNLKCTICDIHSSTSWIPDHIALGDTVPDEYHHKKAKKLTINDPRELENLEYVKFQGGEPLLNEQHLHLLEMFDEIGILQNLVIHYNTNGTQIVDDKVLKLWGKAKLVDLFFSIDDVEERFEYQRFGAKWDHVNDNLKWFTDNLEPNHVFKITTTISLLNICNLKNLIHWKEQNFNYNRLGDNIHQFFQPANGGNSNLSLENIEITLDQKNKIVSCLPNELKSYADSMPVVGIPQQNIFSYLDKLDKIRNTNWRKTFPELVDIFEQHI